MSTVKLQILLKRKMQADELENLEHRLAEIGVTVTGRGWVTLSATMPLEHFERVFSKRFQGRSGFTSVRQMGSTLPVPDSLSDYVDTISETPRHIRMKN